MERKTTQISQAEVERQLTLCDDICRVTQQWGDKPLALVDTYGCQQNEADSERIRGYLERMGFGFTDDAEQARIIVINTCAIREHAEQRVFGNVGALVHTKRRHPEQLICLCGCMVQEKHVAEKIRQSYRHVDLVFGPQALWKFPEMVHTLLTQRGRIFSVADEAGSIAEGIPTVRQDGIKAWVSIMYGCNNFCTYCIVPYVRGRERSRAPEDILDEVRGLVEQGYKDITLLGQNVNSYGKDLPEPMDFSDLLSAVNDIPGDFLIRFMTSHPKDATHKLFETMARCEKVAPVLHLPFQAGNDRILKVMNRRYDKEKYLDLVDRIRTAIPDISLTTDIIVGFPGETEEDFQETLDVVAKCGYDTAFTFLYSKRSDTPAAAMENQVPQDVAKERFNRLLALVQQEGRRRSSRFEGSVQEVLVEEESKEKGIFTGRTEYNLLVHFPGNESLLGKYVRVHLDECRGFYYLGTLEENE